MKHLAATLAALAVAAALIGAAAPEQKCEPRTDAPGLPDYLWLVDGESHGPMVQGMDSLPVPTDQVVSVGIVCWEKVERVWGLKVRAGVVSVWTKDGMASLFEPTLAALVKAQDAFLTEHGRYASHLGELGFRNEQVRLSLAMTATDTGWRATAWYKGVEWLCEVAAGDAENHRPEMTKGAPSCRVSDGTGR